MERRPVALIVMDGFGLSKEENGNAVHGAYTPNLDTLWGISKVKRVLVRASEAAVGLDSGYCGNSEVGHINIGAGGLVPQNLQIINSSIARGEFKKNKAMNEAFQKVKKTCKKLHLVGIISNSGVHSHIGHLYPILEVAKSYGISPFLHLFLDGRDTGEQDAFFFIDRLRRKFRELGVGRIASMTGRFYGMDRNSRWDRTERAYNNLLGIEGLKEKDELIALQKAYSRNENDEYFEPVMIVDTDGKPIGAVEDGDAVFFFNFREDRARQLAQAFAQKNFKEFKRKAYPQNLILLSMIGYAEGLDITTLFSSIRPKVTVSDVLSKHGIRQLHIAETEKYAHISYFFNGGVEKPHENEQFFRIPSPIVKDYVDVPEMSAYFVREEVLSQIDHNAFDFFLINLANPDMIGHTGNYEAAKLAVEVTDECVGAIVNKLLEKNGIVIITSDHGNCEQMINPATGQKDKSHTLNHVPFMIIDDYKLFPQYYKIFQNGPNSSRFDAIKINYPKIGSPENTPPIGILGDVGTTLLHTMGFEHPKEMTGADLLEMTVI